LLKKLSEQLGLHRYAVSTHPDEIVLESPLKKFLDPPMGTPLCKQEFALREATVGMGLPVRVYP